MRPIDQKRQPSACLAGLALLGLLAVPAQASRPVNQTRPAASDVQVSVENIAGSVTVEGWGRDEVSVTGTLGDDVEELSISGDRDHLEIVVETPDHGRHFQHTSADLRIRMPSPGRLEVETVSAFISVSAVTGPIELESVSGDQDVEGSARELDLETVSGNLTVSGDSKRVDAESVSGNVELQGVHGEVEASSVSGNVKVEGGPLQRGAFESVSGSVEFVGSLARSGRLEANSHSGEVTVFLPADISASFRATTFSGRIDSDFGPRPRRTSRYTPGEELEFSTGEGEARITLESFSGGVRIRKQN
jgi:DUF4097 and DUF4098 domain-containing protein YvlB